MKAITQLSRGRARWVLGFAIFIALLFIACGSAVKATPTSTPTPTPAVGGPETPAPEPTATPVRPHTEAKGTATPTPTLTTRVPTPTPRPPGGGVAPISEEQLKEELEQAGFSTFGWKTNFRIRSVSYKEFPNAIPKDAIPAIDNPEVESVQEADRWLDDREPVQVVALEGDVRAYPVQILVWHELVNDIVGGEPLLVTY